MIPSQDQLHQNRDVSQQLFVSPSPHAFTSESNEGSTSNFPVGPSFINEDHQVENRQGHFDHSNGDLRSHIDSRLFSDINAKCLVCKITGGYQVQVEASDQGMSSFNQSLSIQESQVAQFLKSQKVYGHPHCLESIQTDMPIVLSGPLGPFYLDMKTIGQHLGSDLRQNGFNQFQSTPIDRSFSFSQPDGITNQQFNQFPHSSEIINLNKSSLPLGSIPQIKVEEEQNKTLLSFFNSNRTLSNQKQPFNTSKLEEAVDKGKQQNIQPIKIEIPLGDKILGKRQRSSINATQISQTLKEELKHDIDQVRQDLHQDDVRSECKLSQEETKIEEPARVSSNQQGTSSTTGGLQTSDMTKQKIAKALDVNNRFQVEFQSQNDPCQYLLREIMNHVILQVDKLQVLRRDKSDFKILIQPKDLKLLPKERRDEILTSKIYLDSVNSNQFSTGDSIVLTIDNQYDKERVVGTLAGSDSFINSSNFSVKQLDSNQIEPDSLEVEMKDEVLVHQRSDQLESSPSRMEIEESDSSEQRTENQMQINQNNLDKGDDEDKGSKSKKRRKKGFTLANKRNSNLQRAQMNLPGNLSEFLWIENTDLNKDLIERERERQIELRKQKEQEKLQKQMAQDLTRQEGVLPNNGAQTVAQAIDAEEVKMGDLPQKQEKDQIKKESNKDQENTELKGRFDIKNIDEIWERAEVGFYHSLNDLMIDLEHIVMQTIKLRSLNAMAKVYLTQVLTRAVAYIKSKKTEYKYRWRNYYEARYAQNEAYYPKIRGGWYKQAGPKREYNLIDNYKIATPQESNPKLHNSQAAQQNRQDIYEKMKTTKTSQCSGECCLRIEDLGPFKLGSDVWESKCNCRMARVECNESCGCDVTKCRNRQMSLGQALRLGEDVIEKISWGIDMCTAVNLMNLLPRDTPQRVQSDFIEGRLVYAIQQQGPKGYDVREALKYVISSSDANDQEQPQRFREIDKHFAQIVLSGINMVRDKIERHFRVHSKGIGIFCKKKEGIKSNNLIIEYFGEIYQPWNWYEKQDVLKQGQNKSTLSKDLPDFYNITYERHYDDPQGYDILMVDPILYGNYSSRLSHSCSPNCSTVIHIRKGQYSIGMFAIKDIGYGEELCFNYCSLTESEKEYEAAVCLCGTEVCQGRFLQLANDKKHLALMKQYHTFVDRNYLIYKACTFPNLNDEDEKRLYEFGLKQSVMRDVPDWLKKWASLICEYVIYEEQQYPMFMKMVYPSLNEEDLKIDAKNQRDSKVWNVAITIDKIMHVLKQMDTDEPPIRKMSHKEIYQKFWQEEGSFRDSLLVVLSKLENCPEKRDAINMVTQLNNKVMQKIPGEYSQNSEEIFYLDKLNEINSNLAQISDMLRTVHSQTVTIEAFCDILWLYANIRTYFTPNENYKKCRGEEQKIRKCDVRIDNQSQASLNPIEQEKTVYKGQKEYDPGYIWGQLVGWFKQTVDKPNASLSADRRGTLSMPDLESFLVSSKNQEDLKSGIKRKKTKKGGDDDLGEADLETSFLKKSGGTKSRPGGSAADPSNPENNSFGSLGKPNSVKEIRVKYPHKKNQARKPFLDNWADNFSKQWDVCCHWNFKNKQRMYGSVQFESVLDADNDRPRRLLQFNTVVNHLRNL